MLSIVNMLGIGLSAPESPFRDFSALMDCGVEQEGNIVNKYSPDFKSIFHR